MSKGDSFGVGDEVMARWEGSRKYFKAYVLNVLKHDKVQVEFESGEERTVHVKDLKGVEMRSPRRSSSRSKAVKTPSPRRRSSRSKVQTPSPEKATPRRRSVSRDRSKSRSPSRTKKPPATPPTPRRSRSSKRTAEKELTVLKLREVSIPVQKFVVTPPQEEQRRHPSRRKFMQEEEEEIEPKHTESKSDSVAPQRPPSVGRLVEILRGLASLAVIVVLAILPLYLYLACIKNKAIVLEIPPFPRRLHLYLSLKSCGVFLGWASFHFLLTFLPLGKIATLPGHPHLTYRMNGLVSLVVTASGIGVATYYGSLPVGFFWENQLRLTSTGILFSLIFAVLLYVGSFSARTIRAASRTGNVPYDFFMGRELNPRLWMTFDLKLYILRLGFLGWALVDSLLLYKYYLGHGCVSYPLAASAAMQLVYIVETLSREETLLATATFLYDGLGCALTLTFCAWFPFVSTLPVLYLSSGAGPSQLPPWQLASYCVTFLIGLALLRKSLVVKYAFKSHPFHPSLAYLEAIPAGYTRRLIVSGPWGIIRHPNYLGEILVFVAWSLPCGFDSTLPYLPTALTIVNLIFRSLILEGDSRRRHGQSWLHYVSRVRHRIVPYVF